LAQNVIRKFLRLNFENALLNQKLGAMNDMLEERVKERTKELENSLKLVKFQATHDLLTGLPNKRMLMEEMREAIRLAAQTKKMFAIACFAVNNMEKINEGLGPYAADLITKRIAQRLSYLCDNEGLNNHPDKLQYILTIARQDLFFILINPIIDLKEVEDKVTELFAVVDEPVAVQERHMKVSASIGVSLYPRDGVEINTLLMHADSARLRAQQRGGDKLLIYQPGVHMDISRQLEIENHLYMAVRNHELSLQYQPFIDLQSGTISGMEALLRWNCPELGMLTPVEFIPLAEANGTIVQIGEWALRTACAHTAAIHAKGYPNLKVSVNLSAKQVQEEHFLDMISDVLKSTKLQPAGLELELTESEAFREDVLPIIHKLTSMGITLSIDDFGTGYSAFSSLKLFEVGKIKIDKSFVDDLITNSDSKAIVLNTIALGRRMGINVLAEGVETHEQMEYLKQHGCNLIQGYYFSRPVSPDEFVRLLKKQFT
jgi:EAL domain-containing protein (putative c-di-GMP-specific phosphodiesterase class I)/GGDEF domain-containing protein